MGKMSVEIEKTLKTNMDLILDGKKLRGLDAYDADKEYTSIKTLLSQEEDYKIARYKDGGLERFNAGSLADNASLYRGPSHPDTKHFLKEAAKQYERGGEANEAVYKLIQVGEESFDDAIRIIKKSDAAEADKIMKTLMSNPDAIMPTSGSAHNYRSAIGQVRNSDFHMNRLRFLEKCKKDQDLVNHIDLPLAGKLTRSTHTNLLKEFEDQYEKAAQRILSPND